MQILNFWCQAHKDIATLKLQLSRTLAVYLIHVVSLGDPNAKLCDDYSVVIVTDHGFH